MNDDQQQADQAQNDPKAKSFLDGSPTDPEKLKAYNWAHHATPEDVAIANVRRKKMGLPPIVQGETHFTKTPADPAAQAEYAKHGQMTPEALAIVNAGRARRGHPPLDPNNPM
jgi:hypothetical protein